jgi:hypothetical protein
MDFMSENVFEPIQGFGEKIGEARYKSDIMDKDDYVKSSAQVKYDDKVRKYEESFGQEPDEDLKQEFQLEAMQEATIGYDEYKDKQLSLFGQLTTPKSLGIGAGVLAGILAARQSQKNYDDYMAQRPKYDPGENPYLVAQGGGIQAFKQGNAVKPYGEKTIREMLVSNMYEKPLSFFGKSMAAGYAPSDLMEILQIFGMKNGGGIQSFKYGGTDGSAEQFPFNEAQRFTGTVKGPGNGQSDDIPAFLSKNEHVITKQEVETIGRMYGGGVDRGHEVLYSLRGGIKDLGDKMGVSYT